MNNSIEKFDINNFQFNRNYVIDASAGTGKTYSIVQIVEKIIKEKNAKLEEILIVTYTEKAAGELKDRIRALVDNTSTVKPQIFTIHSFCQNVIKEFGITAGLPLNLSLINEKVLEKFVKRYIRCGNFLNDIGILSKNGYKINEETITQIFIEIANKYYLDLEKNEDSSVISFSKEDEKEASRIFKIIKDYGDSNHSLAEFQKKNKEVKELLDALKTFPNNKGKPFYDELEENFKNGNFIFSLKRKEDDPNAAIRAKIVSLKELLSNKKKKDLNTSKILTAIYLRDFYQAWQKEKEHNKAETFDDMIRYVREAILHNDQFLKLLREKYRYGIVDEFQDTNQKQYDIFSKIFLEGEHNNLIVVGDPKQSIYSFQAADLSVYLKAVKDITDKDSKFKGINKTLSKNYRSSATMVKACNHLFKSFNFDGIEFKDSESRNLLKDKKTISIEYEGKPAKPIILAPFNFVNPTSTISEYAEESAKIIVQYILNCCSYVDATNQTKLQLIAETINKDGIRKKDYRNVTFKDFVVLARTKSEMIVIESKLKEANVPFVRFKDDRLFAGRECIQWISIFEAIDADDFTGYNRKIFKKALFTKFFGHSLIELTNDYFNQDAIPEIELINKWKSLALSRKWDELINDIILSSSLIDNLSSLDNLQSLSTYKQIGEYCIEYLSNKRTIKDLIRNLNELSNNELISDGNDDSSNGSIVGKTTDFDAVKILTMHKSKGLQFPIVISVAGFKEPKNLNSILSYHDVTDGNKRKLKIKNLSDNMVNIDKQIETESQSEMKRLFYVAYTRAENQMIIQLPIVTKKELFPYLKDYFVNFLNNNKNDYQILDDTGESSQDLKKKTALILEKNKNLYSPKDDSSTEAKQQIVVDQLKGELYKQYTSKYCYSSFTHPEKEKSEFDPDYEDKEREEQESTKEFDLQGKAIDGVYQESSPLDFPESFPKGSKIGTILHEIFEKLDYTQYKNKNLVNKLIKECFDNNGLECPKEFVDVCYLMVVRVLTAQLPEIEGSKSKQSSFELNSLKPEDKIAEVEFNFNLLGGSLTKYLNGFIDLVFYHDGRYSVLDWKSDSISEDLLSYSNGEHLKQHVDNAYSIQRVLYSYSLIKWLKNNHQDMSEEDIFNQYFGGVYYIFLRGCESNTSNGVYSHTWESWRDLKDAFDNILKVKLGGK